MIDCPSSDELRQFMLGTLSPQQVERIALHLSGPSTCGCHAILQSLESANDEVIEALSGTHDGAPFVHDAACISAVARAEAISRGGVSAAVASRDGAPRNRVTPPQLGRYRHLEPVGRGGMGEVYRAFDQQLRRSVALKIIRQDRFVDDESVARFQAEAETVARLEHPNIVPIYEINQEGQQEIIAMK